MGCKSDSELIVLYMWLLVPKCDEGFIVPAYNVQANKTRCNHILDCLIGIHLGGLERYSQILVCLGESVAFPANQAPVV